MALTMLIPFTLPRQPDELLYSYIQRLAIANGVPHEMFDAAYAISPSALPAGSKHRPRRDSAEDFSKLYVSTRQPGSLLRFYLNSTIFPGYVPLVSRPVLASYVARLSYRPGLDGLVSIRNALLSRVRICPECVREETETSGSCYLHRSHQMVDAAACYKHGCQLLEYDNPGHSCAELSDRSHFKPLRYSSPNVEYERFLHELLHSAIQTSLEDVLPALQAADEKEAQQYHKIPLNKISPRKIAHSLYRVFQTVGTLKEVLPGRDVQIEGRIAKVIYGSCQMTQEYRDDFVELQCLDCGLIYVTTPYRVLQGFRCPDCDSRLGQEALLQRITREAYNGSYELTGMHLGTVASLTLRHKPCGQDQRVNAQHFISGELCCEACNQMTEELMRQKIRDVGKSAFELTGFGNGGQPIILHTLCDRQFVKRYEVFSRHPTCPRCAIDNHRPLAKPEYLWDTISQRSQRKREGGVKCLKYQKQEKYEKAGEQDPVQTIGLGSKSEN